jgi:hypothetical protein
MHEALRTLKHGLLRGSSGMDATGSRLQSVVAQSSRLRKQHGRILEGTAGQHIVFSRVYGSSGFRLIQSVKFVEYIYRVYRLWTVAAGKRKGVLKIILLLLSIEKTS